MSEPTIVTIAIIIIGFIAHAVASYGVRQHTRCDHEWLNIEQYTKNNNEYMCKHCKKREVRDHELDTIT